MPEYDVTNKNLSPVDRAMSNMLMKNIQKMQKSAKDIKRAGNTTFPDEETLGAKEAELVRGLPDQVFNGDPITVDISLVKRLNRKDRQKLLDFLYSVTQSLQQKDDLVQKFLAKAEETFDFTDVVQASVGVAMLSKLLENSETYSKEIVRMTRLIAELTLQWEQLDLSADNDKDDNIYAQNGSDHTDQSEDPLWTKDGEDD